VVADAPVLRIAVTARADDGRSPIREVRVQVDGLTIGPPRAFDPPVAQFAEPFDVPVGWGTHRVSVVATNAQGRSRYVGVDVEQPAPPEDRPRFAVLTIGVPGPFQSAEIRPIDYADLDANDLRDEYGRLAGQVFDEEQVIALPAVADTDATSAAIRAALQGVGERKLALGDTLLVLLETHFAMAGDAGVFVGTDADAALTLANSIPAAELAEQLGEVADTGCRVVVLLDAVHDGAPRSWEDGFREWVRDVRDRDVIPFLASNDGPSERLATRTHGAFAVGLLEAAPDQDATLNDFRKAVTAAVKDFTSNRQQAYCYFPEAITPSGRLFEPGKEAGSD
jgi:hypothetical protein